MSVNVDPDAVGLGDGVLGAHHVVDDPRLAADLGDDPARTRAPRRSATPDTATGAQEPRVCGRSRRRHHDERRTRARARSAACRCRPWCRTPGGGSCCAGGRSSGGTESSPDDRACPCSRPTRNEARPGISIPPLTPSGGAAPEEVLRHVRRGLLHALHRGELDRLVLGDRPRRGVADRELDRRGDAGDGERDQKPEAVVAVAPAAQHPHGVDRGDEEPGDEVRREDHVRDLVRHGRVEDHLQRIDVGRRRRSSA